jgi:1,4-dihydroxy-2-naphthoate octaprenyltransferase
MSTNTTIEIMKKKIVHYSTVSLIFFSIAWFCLTVGVFTINPISPIGIFFLCVGLLCVAISIFYLVHYALISKKVKEASQLSEANT